MSSAYAANAARFEFETETQPRVRSARSRWLSISGASSLLLAVGLGVATQLASPLLIGIVGW